MVIACALYVQTLCDVLFEIKSKISFLVFIKLKYKKKVTFLNYLLRNKINQNILYIFICVLKVYYTIYLHYVIFIQ